VRIAYETNEPLNFGNVMFNLFENQLNPFPAIEPTQPPKTLVAFCFHYTKGAWGAIIGMAVLTAIIAVIEVTLFGFLGNIVDWLSLQSRDTFLAQEGWRLTLIGVLIVVVLPFVALLHSLFMHQSLLGNYPMRIRWQVHRYLLKQSLSFYQDEFAGRVATKLMQTALAVRECVMKVLDVLNYVGIYFLGMLFLLASLDTLFVIPMMIWIVSYVGLLRFFIPRLRKVGSVQADLRSTMTGRIVDSYTNIATVKLFSHSKREESFAREGMMDFLKSVYSQMRLVTVLYTLLYVLNALLLFSISALGIYLWLSNSISIGSVAVPISLVLRLHGMSQWIMWEVSALFEHIGTVEDGMTSISMARLVQDAPNAKDIEVTEGGILFDNVQFHYGKGSGIIENLALNIKAGEKVGLVGRSGAGKSTLVNLLLRFYDLESGRILIDGQDISTITQDSLRAHIGMVTQDTSLLHRSVRDNILYGKPDALERDLIKAAERAAATGFIQNLSDPYGRTGFDAHVGERGVKLSGGQRQRIAIARVMLKNAPILILDEATSALDSEIEAAIAENLYTLMQNKTVIAIAHRLSTIAALDRLIVLDNGVIVEDGSHSELIAKGGIYAKLWERQSGGFLGLETV
jgi:ATP-binding cassette, subfamily B, multidrug efflux pump